MKVQEIMDLIENPGMMNENTAGQLKTLLEDYPYFQTARLLYLINLHSLKDSEFNSELKMTACYAGDRRKLYLLVNGKKFEPLNIDLLEQEDDSEEIESSFELIDFFLAGKSDKNRNQKEDIASVRKIPVEDSSGFASVDYMTYFLSENDAENKHVDEVPLQHQATIDEFLRKDAESPVKVTLKEASDRLEDDASSGFDTVEVGDFFSETLAKIYVKQRKYDKAIEIIRKLHLVYPEKNIYFADQIRFLEKLITNTQKKE